MTASCAVISGASATASATTSASLCLSKRGPAEVTSWPGTRYFQPSAQQPLHLHSAPPASLVSVYHSLFLLAWIMVRGSLHLRDTTASLQLGEEKNRVESQFPTENMPVTCSCRPISTVGTSGDGILFCYGRLLLRTYGFEACQ